MSPKTADRRAAHHALHSRGLGAFRHEQRQVEHGVRHRERPMVPDHLGADLLVVGGVDGDRLAHHLGERPDVLAHVATVWIQI